MVRLIGADVDGTPGARYPLAWLLLALPTTGYIAMLAPRSEWG